MRRLLIAAVCIIVLAAGGAAAWKFLRLTGSDLELDKHEYFVAELGRIMGIFCSILKSV